MSDKVDEEQVSSEINDNDAEYEKQVSLSMQDQDLSDRQIEQIFDQGRFRFHQDRNDFTLPQILDFVEKKYWVNVRPEYQRRLRWDKKKKSRLIESLLMNVPVPPIFLYEYDINRYEVMDGQQRLNSIIEFFNNEFPLSGLQVWSSLNGRRFLKLPARIRRGLERAKISSIILVTDTGVTPDPAIGDLRTQVFDRLNTGGEKLNAQELRNCLYAGPLNDLIVELASNPMFTYTWGIPSHEENINEDGSASEKLRRNSLYKQMKDCEIVLRFFAFLDQRNVRGSVRSMLDRYMLENRDLDESKIDTYRQRFLKALEVNRAIFGAATFRLPPNEQGRRQLSRPLYDALMIAMDTYSDHEKQILDNASGLDQQVRQALEDEEAYSVIVGKPNTADAIKERIQKMKEIVGSNVR